MGEGDVKDHDEVLELSILALGRTTNIAKPAASSEGWGKEVAESFLGESHISVTQLELGKHNPSNSLITFDGGPSTALIPTRQLLPLLMM